MRPDLAPGRGHFDAQLGHPPEGTSTVEPLSPGVFGAGFAQFREHGPGVSAARLRTAAEVALLIQCDSAYNRRLPRGRPPQSRSVVLSSVSKQIRDLIHEFGRRFLFPYLIWLDVWCTHSGLAAVFRPASADLLIRAHNFVAHLHEQLKRSWPAATRWRHDAAPRLRPKQTVRPRLRVLLEAFTCGWRRKTAIETALRKARRPIVNTSGNGRIETVKCSREESAPYCMPCPYMKSFRYAFMMSMDG